MSGDPPRDATAIPGSERPPATDVRAPEVEGASAAPGLGGAGHQSQGRRSRSLMANVASLAASQVITWTFALLWTFIVPRLIGPEEMGLLVIATSVTSVAAVVLGVTTRDFLVRQMVSDLPHASMLLVAALLTRVAVVPLVFLVGVAYVWFADLGGAGMAVICILAGATAFTMLTEPGLAVFQATERMQYMAYTDVVNKTLQTLGGVLLAYAGFGVVAIAGLNFVVAGLALLLALRWVHRLIGLRAHPAPVAPLVRAAGPYWLVAVFFVAYLWADGLLLGILVPTEVVGWYGAATRLFTTLMFIAAVIAAASLPRLITAHASAPERMFAVAREPFEWVIIIGLPLGVGLACVADDLVPILYGPDYVGATPALAILALGIPLMYMNIMVNQLFIAGGRPKVMATVLAAAAAVNISLNLVLIPLTQERLGNGAVGAAASLLLTEVVQVVIGMALIGRRLLIRSTLQRIVTAWIASAGMAAAVILASPTPLLMQVLVGIAVFAALAVLLHLPTPAELAAARRGVFRVQARIRLKRTIRAGGS